MNQGLSNYQKMQVSGMSQRDLIVLLHSGAEKFLRQAQTSLAEKQMQAFYESVERVHRIIFHLYTTLDFDQGGEIARILGNLYTFAIGQLNVLNSTKNEQIIVDLLAIINELKAGWQGISPGAVDGARRVQQTPAGTTNALSMKV